MVTIAGLGIHYQKAPQLSKEWGEGQLGDTNMSLIDEYQDRIRSLDEFIKDPKKLINDFLKLTEITTRDLDKCVDMCRAFPGDQTRQRLVVRVTFSIIDSICYKFKELIYCTAKYVRLGISEGDEEFLIGYKKENSGDIKRCYPGFSEYVKRSLKIAFRYFGADTINFNDINWQNFQDSINIRDRITHPKRSSDLSISQQEYDMVANAFVWFKKCIFEITVAFSGVAKVKWKKK